MASSVTENGTAEQKLKAARIPRTSEAVTAGALFARMIRGFFALTQEVDDAEREYGMKLYESMMNDPAVGSSVDVIRQAAVRLPRLRPPQELRTQPGKTPTSDESRAAEICKACERALHRPVRPFVDTLYELAYGLVEDKLAEIVLEKVTDGPDAGLLSFKAFKFKPRSSWRYVVDDYGNVGFIAGTIPVDEKLPADNEAPLVPGSQGYSVLLEPDRFITFAWGARDSDPRCKPILRRAYNAWNLKVRTWPEKLKGDAQFGTPSVAVIMPEDMQDPESSETAGKSLPDGSPVQTAEDLMLYATLQVANGVGGAFPNGTTIQVIESQRDGAALNSSIELYNKEIAAAILHAPRTTQEARHGSRADSESSGDVTELLVRLIRGILAGLIRNALTTLVRLNYGPEAAERMVPEVTLGQVAEHDMPNLINAFSAWVKTGAPTVNQLAEIDAKIDLRPRDMGEKSLADINAERLQQQMETQAAANKPGAVDDEDDGDKERKDDAE